MSYRLRVTRFPEWPIQQWQVEVMYVRQQWYDQSFDISKWVVRRIYTARRFRVRARGAFRAEMAVTAWLEFRSGVAIEPLSIRILGVMLLDSSLAIRPLTGLPKPSEAL